MNEKIKEQCRNLWRDCFHDSERYMDYYFEEKCRDNRILTDMEENRVVSMVHMNPYELMWQGKKIKSYYIVGVATEEGYRKQGRMRTLLNEAFEQMQKEQIPFTYLMPANRKIYEPFDFQTIYKQERVYIKGIKNSLLKAAQLEKEKLGVMMRFFDELSPEEQAEVIRYCNHKLSKEFDLYVARSIEYYLDLQLETRAMEGGIAVFMADQKEVNSIVGVVPYGLENGYLEVIEALIETEYSEEIIEQLLTNHQIEDNSQILFYETYFLDKEVLGEIGVEQEKFYKEATMIKVFGDNASFGEVFWGQKVYLNELV